MPRGNGTGPMYSGSMNGRGLGAHTGANTVKHCASLGLGLACRRGRGFGRCSIENIDSSTTRKELLQGQKNILQNRIYALDMLIERL